ncbi:hypothetical protein NLJ89_g10054 [Agrocybe chaxingu]|uniref:Uncharacterized protein n=1 Tax=Agrocybe chaxingu TaxID=84603 RepID=A0A9W8JZF0_9AGAR|nr:hypothetical protein NLJ89_g10054 [Agrocybe chaxingu]
MASCQTWTTTSHFRHPWFDTAVMKRKLTETVTPEEDSDDTPGPASRSLARPPAKRRRFSNLENGFAHLSIVGSSASNDYSMSLPPAPQQSYIYVEEIAPPVIPSNAMDTDMAPPATEEPAYTVEEPTVPEVKMKTSSWYEPEPDRIVITDLEAFTESDDEDEEKEEEKENVAINFALLDRIRNKKAEESLPTVSSPGASQALVLFRPLARLSEESGLSEARKEEKEKETRPVEVDENAMDVEP